MDPEPGKIALRQDPDLSGLRPQDCDSTWQAADVRNALLGWSVKDGAGGGKVDYPVLHNDGVGGNAGR